MSLVAGRAGAALLAAAVVSLGAAREAPASYLETLGQGSRAGALGNAYIGVADDLWAVWYNPAGLTQLIGGRAVDVSLATNFFHSRLRYSQPIVDERSRVDAGSTQRPDSEFPTIVAAPSFAAGFEIGERLYLSPISLMAPYAAAGQWDALTGDARYTAAESGQVFFTWAPSAALRVTEWLSIGGGVDVVVAQDVWLDARIGDGAIGRGGARTLTGREDGPFERIISTVNGVDDGKILLRVDQDLSTGLSPVNDIALDFGAVGFHVGVMLFPTEWLRVGAVYRSRIDTEVEGDIEIEYEDLIENGFLYDLLRFDGDRERFRFDFPLPQSVGVGMSAQLTNQWMLSLDWTWVDWGGARGDDRVSIGGDGLTKTLILPGYEEIVIPRGDYRSVHSVRAGLEWRPLEQLRLGAGFWYDPSPTPDRFYDFASDPGDRLLYSVGAGLVGLFDGLLDLDTHVQIMDVRTRHVGLGESEILGGLSEVPGPDPEGRADPIFTSNDGFAVDVGGSVITVGITATLHL